MRFTFLLLLCCPLPAQGADWIRANYEKREVQVPMRDGKLLFTAIYSPKDRARNWPILMRRTPYGVAPYGPEMFPTTLGPSELATRELFHFVLQDVRGRWMSEGEFVNVRPHVPGKQGQQIDESSDTWDTIEWLLKNVAGHNGKVGMWGISYPGFYVSAGMIDAHPALVACSPQAPVGDWFIGDDFHHNGALYLAHAFHFFSGFGRPRPQPTKDRPWRQTDFGTKDGYQFFLELGPLAEIDRVWFQGDVAFWNEMLEHETYDAFWKARDIRPHLKAIAPAVLTVGGWFDAEDLFGALQTYQAVETQGCKSENLLVMGPWVHGGWARQDGDRLGAIEFGGKTSPYYREQIELPFFRRHLKGGPEHGLPEASIFETGSNRWRRFAQWPPKGRSEKLWLTAGGGLVFGEGPRDAARPFTEWQSDPDKPVPYIEEIAIGMTKEHMVADQRFAARRPDVVVFQTAPLEKDLTLAGPIVPELWVSTSGTDSDFVVKLIDVRAADGYQQLVRGEPFRGKFRRSFEKPEPFVPGEPSPITFAMPDVCHTFRKDHRIMVQVQSSWFPLVDRNPQTFCEIPRAGRDVFQKATQRVWHAPGRASALAVLVLDPEPAK
jgi:hypothetical protein